MKGRRLPDCFTDTPDFAWDKVQTGDYFKQKDGGWFLMSPSGESGGVNAPTWTITEHDDGTITVSPSIWFNKESDGWHGFLERGWWRRA